MMWFVITLLLLDAPDVRFRMATQALTDQDPATAVRELVALEAEGYANGPLFVNLGIAYTHLDSLGLAKYYFLKAGRFSDVNLATQTGLQHVETQMLRRASGLPVLSLNRFINGFLWTYPDRLVAILFIVLVNIGIGLRIGHWITSSSGASTASWVALGLATAVLVVMLSAMAMRHQFGLGIVTLREGALRAEPDTTADAIVPVYEGYEVRMDRQAHADGWTRVTLINGSTGWLPTPGVRAF